MGLSPAQQLHHAAHVVRNSDRPDAAGIADWFESEAQHADQYSHMIPAGRTVLALEAARVVFGSQPSR